MVLPECFLLAFLSVTVLVAGEVDLQLPETRIINGFFIDITEVPWQAHVRIRGSGRFGGVVISDLWVLTAAHCTRATTAPMLSFRVGSTSRKEGGKIYQVQQVVNHEKFDISLLRSASPIEFGKSVAPVKLPHLGAKHPPAGTMLRASGWGATEKNGTNMLKAVDIMLYDAKFCRKWGVRENSKKICAGLPGKNVCFGDSGGPLVKGDLLVGIASYVITCYKGPGVYVDVAEFMDWIDTHTRDDKMLHA